ncbi:MAG: ribonuclease E/G [Firmicutes bacterium]|nr:ribonuclease E/G [Bacillota bacterium]
MKILSKLIITPMVYRQKEVIVAALMEQNRICQLHIAAQENKGILGNIYIGKVQSIVKNIHAAFIEIANGVNCYYSMDEKSEIFFTNQKKDKTMKIGDEVLVQVSREGIKTKLPCVTGNLNFTGRYLVLTSQRKELGFSGKLKKEEKKRIRAILEGHLPKQAGLIVRTNCRDADTADILRELEQLQQQYEDLLKKASTRVCFSLLEESMPDYMQVLQSTYTKNLEEIVTDDKTIFQQIQRYLQCYETKAVPVRFYEDSLLPLAKLYCLESAISEGTQERVWLKSGGFLVIQQTEAFVCIDVNTGKFSEKKEIQDTFRKINLEAAREIAWQLRLRNLSGIILIDFINLEKEEDKKELLQNLQGYLKQDPVKGTVVDMTPLNIVEVTRKKVRKSLQEELNALEK